MENAQDGSATKEQVSRAFYREVLMLALEAVQARDARVHEPRTEPVAPSHAPRRKKAKRPPRSKRRKSDRP